MPIIIIISRHQHDSDQGIAQYLFSLQLPIVSATFPAKLSRPSGFSPGVVHGFPSIQFLLLTLLLRAAHETHTDKHRQYNSETLAVTTKTKKQILF